MNRSEAGQRVRAHLLASAEVKQCLAESHLDTVLAVAEMVASTLRSGKKLMLCGNGGSAADSQHIAAEFTNRLRAEWRRPALAAVALTTDTTFLTSHANDYGFEYVFQRQIEALGRAGDVLVAISTSGNSKNVIRAVQACRSRGIKTVGLLGAKGGRLRSLVDLPLIVPSDNTQHIQEAHIALGHIIADLVEGALFERSPLPIAGAVPMVSGATGARDGTSGNGARASVLSPRAPARPARPRQALQHGTHIPPAQVP
jgi:D-sedoheptulose 7-phosphate isomerase